MNKTQLLTKLSWLIAKGQNLTIIHNVCKTISISDEIFFSEYEQFLALEFALIN
jgi:hypothetical protein